MFNRDPAVGFPGLAVAAVIQKGWLDWCERVPGPANKQFPQPNKGEGIACHSVVGNLPGHTVPRRFFDANDQASVMLILYRDGHVIQMYPVTSSTWTSGSFEANTRYWAIEAEGGGAPDYGEKLTQAAADSFIRIVTEWEAHTGRTAAPGVNILQHRDLVAIYGGGATACASDRYSNAWARVAAGERYDDMTPEEREEHRALVTIMGGRAKLLDNAARGNDFILGYANEQQKLAEHLSNHAAGVTGMVPEHSHQPGKVVR